MERYKALLLKFLCSCRSPGHLGMQILWLGPVLLARIEQAFRVFWGFKTVHLGDEGRESSLKAGGTLCAKAVLSGS